MGFRGLAFWIAVACLASASSSAQTVKVEVLRPVAGEPAVDRVTVAASVESEGPIAEVELEVDGRVVHRWTGPPYEFVHDFGLAGKERVIVVRAFAPEGESVEVSLITPAIKVDDFVDLELQQVYATVVDRKGRRVTSLGGEDFEVRDLGIEQEIVTFGVGEVAFTAVLLVDASPSMAGRRLAAAFRATQGFVDGMRANDQAQIVAFSDRLLQASSIDGKRGLRAAAFGPVKARGGTAIRDHLFLALRLLEERQGRRVVVLLTDGWDQVSVVSSELLETTSDLSQSVVYWVRLAGDEPTSFHRLSGPRVFGGRFGVIRYNPAPSSWKSDSDARKAYRHLEGLVESTGGRVITTAGLAEVEAAVRDVLAELHEQYAIGYYPKGETTPVDGWRPVEVKLQRPGLAARVREGYVDR